jgi:F-type H+-transporting ATPase subunit delta
VRSVSIAANYAEALFRLGERSGQTEAYAGLITAVASAVLDQPLARAVMMSPKVTKAVKGEILARALPQAPREFVLFLQAVVKRGRQNLFGEIALAYRDLFDAKLNRVRAAVTMARMPSAALQQALVDALTEVVGKEVLAEFMVDPDLLGGVLVRIDDRVYDGTVRRRMTRLRRQLLSR